MKQIRIGVLGPSNIAFRRMVPALKNSTKFCYVGVACASAAEWSDEPINENVIEGIRKRAEIFRECYGGDVFSSYEELLSKDDVDAVYIPLPPGLHFKWAKSALEHGKHVLLEKPFSTCVEDTAQLIEFAKNNNLAVHENYAFLFHKQIEAITSMIQKGELGEFRLMRATFSFPYRGESDFRYHKSMGGGALLDCGGYPIRLALHLLGSSTRVATANLLCARNHDVDVYGSATLVNNAGRTAQLSFGMDNTYKCDIELFGSLASVSTGRVYSPPADMITKLIVKRENEERMIEIPADDQFQNSAEWFAYCVFDDAARAENFNVITKQAFLMKNVIDKSELPNQINISTRKE